MSDQTDKPQVGTPFRKGQSGNPGGRPKGLARLVRDTVGDDIVEIIKAQAAIARGQKPAGLSDLPPIKAADITKAAEWIGDRGWGKALQQVDLSGDLGGARRVDYSRLTDAELDKMLEADEIAARVAADDLLDPEDAEAPELDGPGGEG